MKKYFTKEEVSELKLSSKDIDKIYNLLKSKESIEEVLDIDFIKLQVATQNDEMLELNKKFSNNYQMIMLKAEMEKELQNNLWQNMLTIALGIFTIILVNLLETPTPYIGLVIMLVIWVVILIGIIIFYARNSFQKNKARYILSIIESVNKVVGREI